MSSLYKFGVLKLEASKIQITAEVIHPDSNYLKASPGFALMLLYDNINDSAPLKQEVDFDDLFEDSWMTTNARAFIKSVTLKLDKLKKNKWKSGVLDIEVTHPAWLEHMKGIDTWDSASYDPVDSYDPAEPRFPEDNDSIVVTETDSKEGFMPIWKYMIPGSLLHNQNDIFWFPAFGEKHYKASDTPITDLSDDAKLKLEGTLVKTPESFGVFSKRATDWGIVTFGRGSIGSTYIDGEMTKMYFNPKKKGGYANTPESLIVWSKPLAYETKINGDTITFKFMFMDDDNDRVSLQSKMSALELLLKPFEDYFQEKYEGESPLCEVMNDFLKENNIHGTSTIYIRHKEMAEQFIADAKVEKIRDIPFPSFDNLSNEEIIALYDFEKWPAYQVSIQVTDKKWLEHYPQTPFSHIFERYDS